jgi:hypothetical protein
VTVLTFWVITTAPGDVLAGRHVDGDVGDVLAVHIHRLERPALRGVDAQERAGR